MKKVDNLETKCGISCLLDQCNYVTVNKDCIYKGKCEFQRPLERDAPIYEVKWSGDLSSDDIAESIRGIGEAGKKEKP